MFTPVIMAGGTGSRLWPLSRQQHPKQFLPLCGEQTMLQQTVQRLSGLDAAAPLLICNEDHRFLLAEQLRQIGVDAGKIILEPVGKNTAPAIALAAFSALASGRDPVLLVLAADHYIKDTVGFQQAVRAATQLANQEKLVTFGIVPDSPETGYGYIQRGEPCSENGFKVQRFVEKPSLGVAQQYLASGDYYWNSGMFMFKASVYLQALKKFRADIYTACEQAVADCRQDLDFTRLNEEAFLQCPEDSIDYAVMEKTSDAAMVPLDAGWSDVGAWNSLWQVGDKDINGNVASGDTLLLDSHDSLVHSTHKLIATLGVNNLVIVETKDAVLVASKDDIQQVKAIVDELKANNRQEVIHHREVYRPWGHYDSIDLGERYQVKRLHVKPGHKASLQMHYHRSEHWVVVKGTAKVIVGDKQILLTENQSVYIPIGEKHSIENPGKTPLEVIEVQSGTYLGEDDIVRFEDTYGRC